MWLTGRSIWSDNSDSGDYVLVGSKAGGAEFGSVGATFGAKTNTLTTANLAAHTHSGTTDTGGSHTHRFEVSGQAGGGGYNTVGYGSGGNWQGAGIEGAGSHNHTFITGSTGSASPVNNIQPSRSATLVIKT